MSWPSPQRSRTRRTADAGQRPAAWRVARDLGRRLVPWERPEAELCEKTAGGFGQQVGPPGTFLAGVIKNLFGDCRADAALAGFRKDYQRADQRALAVNLVAAEAERLGAV